MNHKDYFNLLEAMTQKEIKARYKNAVLGFLWIFLNPLLQMIIMGIVFQNFVKIPVQTNSYFLFLFPGLLIWNFFSLSLTKATSSIVWQRNLIQKAKFPRKIIPFSIILSNFLNFLISIIILVIFLILTNNLYLNLNKILILVISFVWLLGLTCGLSLFTSALNVKYRDISFFTRAVILLWFYVSPIVYPLNSIPANYLFLFKINPLVSILELIKFSLINNPSLPTNVLIPNILISILIVTSGITVFKIKSKNFADWL